MAIPLAYQWLFHWRHQLEVVSIHVCQGRYPPASHFIGLLDDLAAEGLDSLKLLFDLRGLKIEHHPAGVFGVAVHGGMLQHSHVAIAHPPSPKTMLPIDHVSRLAQDFFVETR